VLTLLRILRPIWNLCPRALIPPHQARLDGWCLKRSRRYHRTVPRRHGSAGDNSKDRPSAARDIYIPWVHPPTSTVHTVAATAPRTCKLPRRCPHHSAPPHPRSHSCLGGILPRLYSALRLPFHATTSPSSPTPPPASPRHPANTEPAVAACVDITFLCHLISVVAVAEDFGRS